MSKMEKVMEVDAEKLLLQAIKDGLREGIKSKLTNSYNNPFDGVINGVLQRHSGEVNDLLSEALQAAIGDPVFKEEIRAATRSVLAKTLVARFGGELEKQINALKSNPATRARITVAIDEIVKSHTQPVSKE
jgi:hypothetical protein